MHVGIYVYVMNINIVLVGHSQIQFNHFFFSIQSLISHSNYLAIIHSRHGFNANTQPLRYIILPSFLSIYTRQLNTFTCPSVPLICLRVYISNLVVKLVQFSREISSNITPSLLLLRVLCTLNKTPKYQPRNEG